MVEVIWRKGKTALYTEALGPYHSIARRVTWDAFSGSFTDTDIFSCTYGSEDTHPNRESHSCWSDDETRPVAKPNLFASCHMLRGSRHCHENAYGAQVEDEETRLLSR
jgi:hypothetical protein